MNMASSKRTYELKVRAERQDQTRQQIIDATVALHEEVGPAQTTIAEIARRAGVTRLTVYNHFPEDGDLFAACQGSYLSHHPLPDYTPALALTDPRDRVRTVLESLYRSYREREPMTSKVVRDRGTVPALDRLLTKTMDAQQATLTTALAAPYDLRGDCDLRLRATIGLGLDFATWQRFTDAGLTDPSAADLMTDLILRAAKA